MEQQLETAASFLRQGKVVALPTDTLYGLGANPFMEKAVDRIFQIKGRPKDMALPLLLSHIEDLSKYAKVVSPLAWKLAYRFLPGALTLVLLKSPHIPDSITGGTSSVALRVPDHPVPRLLADMIGAPVTGTSANFAGMPAATSAEEVRRQMEHVIDFIIDAGPPPKGIASTIIDLTSPRPKLLRDGFISREQLQEACGEIIDVSS